MSDNQLTDLFLYYAYMEQEIELLRELLCSEPYFQPYNLFKMIDCLEDDPKGYLTERNISIYLQILKFPANLPSKCFIENYNQNKDGKLVYSEFLRSLLPINNPQLRETITQQTPIEQASINEKIQYMFAKLIEAEIKLTIQAENFKKHITLDDFNQICYEGYIFHSDIQNYFKYKHISTNSQEIQLIFNRVDLQNDGKIDKNEWKLWFCQRKSLTQIHTYSYKKPQTPLTIRYTSVRRKQQDTTMSDLLALSKQGYTNNNNSIKKPPLYIQYSTPTKYQKQKTDLRAQLNSSIQYNSNNSNYSIKTNKVKGINEFYEDEIQTLKKTKSIQQYDQIEPVQYYVQLFLNLIQIEKKIERQKVLLSNHNDFSLFGSFQKLDKGHKGIIIQTDLLSYCKNPLLLLRRYGKDNKIRFSDYIKMIEPKDQHSIDLLINKDQQTKIQMKQDTEISLRLLLELIEQKLIKINEVKYYQSKQRFQISEIFYMLAYDRKQITIQDIQDFLLANQYTAKSVDIELLITEFDYDGDGIISYNDFIKTLDQ